MKFLDAANDGVTSIVNFVTLEAILLHGMFRQLPVNGRDMNVRQAEINVGLANGQRKKGL
jgi:hypothetical protein